MQMPGRYFEAQYSLNPGRDCQPAAQHAHHGQSTLAGEQARRRVEASIPVAF